MKSMFHDLLVTTGLIQRFSMATARRWVSQCMPGAEITGRLGREKQLLIDVSVIHENDAGTGIQRVVRSVSMELERNPPPGYTVRRVALTRHAAYRYVGGANSGEPVLGCGPGDVFLGLDLVAHWLWRNTRQLLEWKRCGMKLHFVVYDLLPLLHPVGFTAARTRHFKRWAKVLAVFADSVLCISEAVRNDMNDWLTKSARLPSTALPMHVISLGSDFPEAESSVAPAALVASAVERLGSQPWVLMVGTVEPRKCHAQVLDAFEYLWRHESATVALVIVGHPGWKTEALQQRIRAHAQRGRLLHWFENATDADLAHFYRHSTGVIVASLAEGYGLPIVEALGHGKPVLVRDIPVFHEVGGDNVDYFVDDAAAPLAKRLKQWLGVKPHAFRAANDQATTWAQAARRLIRTLGISTISSASGEA